MSRIFVSYRRADGMYATGWIAERLSRLDLVTGVESTFHDSTLEAGAPLKDALDAELAVCDVLIAVITPEWQGRRADGTSRIMDEDDWIVREIRAALDHGTTIIPIMVDGADHPLPSEMHPSIRPFYDLLAKPFHDGTDLETVVEQIESQLDQIDRRRASEAGLTEPVTVPKLTRPWLIAAASVVLGVALALLMWWATSSGVGGGAAGCGETACIADTSAYNVLEVALPILGLACGALAAVGGALALRVHRLAQMNWLAIAAMAGGLGVSLTLISIAARSGQAALADVPSLPDPWLRFGTYMLLALVGAFGLVICFLAPIHGEVRAGRYVTRDRIAFLAIARDAERWAATFLSALFAVITGSGALLIVALGQANPDYDPSPLPNIVFALVFSVMLILVHRWALASLADLHEEILDEIAELPPRFRANAEPRLEARSFDVGGWGFRAFLSLPLIVALVAAVAMAVA